MTKTTCLQLAVLPLFAVLALGSGSPSKKEESSTTQTTSAPIQKVGFIGGFEWTVLDIVDRGARMKATEPGLPDATTSGKFIQLHYKVANNGTKTSFLIAGATKLVDAAGREFTARSEEVAYIPRGAEVNFGIEIQPSMSKELYAIYEVPADANVFSLKVGDWKGTRSLLVGAIPKAPAVPDPAPSASAPAPKAIAVNAPSSPAGKTKAKTAPPKK